MYWTDIVCQMLSVFRKGYETMGPIESYKANPCKMLSIPYWKAKSISVLPDMKIVHDSEYDGRIFERCHDTKYFRLIHTLSDIPELTAPGISLETIPPHQTDELAEMINRCYTHSQICVSGEYVKGLTETPVYCPELWIGAVFNGNLIGSVLCDYDAETGEGIIEWLQVLPKYRGRGIASALVCKGLKIMSGFADFATVSGECENVTNPEGVYRKCGFTGNDVWHILRGC